MALIEWRDEFSIGIPAIDKEHREMIDLLNEMAKNLETENDVARGLKFFGDVHANINAHFALEERIMREHNYEDLINHKADHEVLLDEIRYLMDEYEAGHYDQALHKLAGELETWFSNHFKEMDARLHAALG
jgi:hemerythrin